jgi:predicted HTH transcriptional regulator
MKQLEFKLADPKGATTVNVEFLDTRKQNSREARERHLPKAATNKGRIYFAIVAHRDPIHARHLAQLIEVSYSEIQRRLSEIVSDGLIEPCGRAKVIKSIENGVENYSFYTLYKIRE